MRRPTARSILCLALTAGLLVAACADDPAIDAIGYDGLDGPLLVAGDGDDLSERWRTLARPPADDEPADDEPADDEPPAIAGLEPFNDPRMALSDGRFIVRGRWDGDDVIASWSRRTPAAVPEDGDHPVVDTSARPVRLFVFDPGTGELTPLSHVPAVHPYSTAVSVGASPDVVLDVAVLRGEELVAYAVGFSGAGYDLVRAIYVAPIPPR